MKLACARVSSDDQKMDLQRDALTAAGCEKVFTNTASGAKTERPGLSDALAFARKGGSLVVWRLDRLGRSLPELVKIVGDLEAADVGFESTTERIETLTPLSSSACARSSSFDSARPLKFLAVASMRSLGVASRTIIRTLIEEMWMRSVPIFHRLHRRFAFQS